MPSDVDAPKGGAPKREAPPRSGGPLRRRVTRLARAVQRLARPVLRPFRPFGRASARLLDYLGADERRRFRSSTALSIAFNFLLFAFLAAYGRFEIWIPATPGDFINITMVDLPPEPEPPAPAVVPERKPEIVKKPKLEPKPVPAPEPKKPEAPKPKPKPEEPKPIVDLVPKPVFAPPRAENEAPTVGAAEAPAPQPEEERAPPAPEPAQSEKLAVEPQSPSAATAGLDVAPEAQNEKKADVTAGDENLEKKKKEEEAAPSGDDQFDANPFGPAPSRMALPAVNLPEGVKEEGGGKSGVVAIFCPEQFKNKDKAAECAGRTQILSGWKPGSSGEDWSRAIALLKSDRAAGKTGPDVAKTLGPAAARRIKDAENVNGLTDFRRNAAKTPGAPSEDNLTAGWGRPDIGPAPYNPNWALRDDPLVTNKEVNKLGKDLDAANAAKKAPADSADDADKKKPK